MAYLTAMIEIGIVEPSIATNTAGNFGIKKIKPKYTFHFDE